MGPRGCARSCKSGKTSRTSKRSKGEKTAGGTTYSASVKGTSTKGSVSSRGLDHDFLSEMSSSDESDSEQELGEEILAPKIRMKQAVDNKNGAYEALLTARKAEKPPDFRYRNKRAVKITSYDNAQNKPPVPKIDMSFLPEKHEQHIYSKQTFNTARLHLEHMRGEYEKALPKETWSYSARFSSQNFPMADTKEFRGVNVLHEKPERPIYDRPF